VQTVDATIDALTADPPRTALLLDFDGSLAPIVPRPEDAVPLPGTPDVLDNLAQRLGRVGVVSGRPVAFLTQQLPSPRLAFVGQYGLEWVEGGAVVVDERAVPYVEAVARAAAEAERRWPDLYVERKGDVAVTVHWRNAPSTGNAVVADIDALASRLGLEVHPSKMARELRPPIGVDKGVVVERLSAGMRAVAFAGDDAGDLPAFEAIERGLATGAVDRAVRIAVTSTEAPPEVLQAGDIVVDGPTGLRALLDRLLAALT
jgi:trehalose 6-phosphate phosphatase